MLSTERTLRGSVVTAGPGADKSAHAKRLFNPLLPKQNQKKRQEISPRSPSLGEGGAVTQAKLLNFRGKRKNSPGCTYTLFLV